MIGYITKLYYRFERGFKKLLFLINLVQLRHLAHKDRKRVIKRKGKSVVNREVKKAIKEYARERFGSKAYWPYLAYYTEMRGEFVKGWIPDDYFTTVVEIKLNPRIYSNISGVKTYDHRLFGDFAVRPLFLFIKGLLYDADLNLVKESQLKDILSDHDGELVLKEEFGYGGKQVRMIHSSEFKPEQLRRGTNYVIQPYIKQHKILSDLYPDSVNTFRVASLFKNDGSIDIKFVILRFGVDGVKVDNMSSGGQCIYIDPSGKPSRLAYDNLGLAVGERHQNTGYVYSDLKIPMFNDIVESCRTAHLKYPYVGVVGWDVCIDEHGKPKLLEWNAYNSLYAWVDALYGPFMTDDDEIK